MSLACKGVIAMVDKEKDGIHADGKGDDEDDTKSLR